MGLDSKGNINGIVIFQQPKDVQPIEMTVFMDSEQTYDPYIAEEEVEQFRKLLQIEDFCNNPEQFHLDHYFSFTSQGFALVQEDRANDINRKRCKILLRAGDGNYQAFKEGMTITEML